MARSVWKGPVVDGYLLKKAEAARASGRNEVIKIWSRRSTILPQFVGLTFGVHCGDKHVPVVVSEDMIGQKFGAVVAGRGRAQAGVGGAKTPRAPLPLDRGQPKRRARLETNASDPAMIAEFAHRLGVIDPPRPMVALSAYAPGPRARAVLKGVEIAEEDLRRSGGAYDADQVSRLLRGASLQSVEALVREGRLLSVPGPNGEARFPAAQFKDDGSIVEGLRETQDALPTKNGFAVLDFLVSRDARLGGRRPIDLLVDGEVDLVVEAARRLGEQGA
jgi:ribosomal protein S19